MNVSEAEGHAVDTKSLRSDPIREWDSNIIRAYKVNLRK